MMTGELFLKFVRGLTFGFLLIVVCALVSHAQNSGTVGIKTNEIGVFTNQSSTLSSGGSWQCGGSPTPIACLVLPDIGAACSTLAFQTTAFSGTIDLEW